MSLKDLFDQNPFQNLIVAGRSTADFPLRGHKQQLDERFCEISTAIENPDYPANAQHTIVFGEWGHGKTHVLRTIEYKINQRFSARAKVVFFEPSSSDPEDILQELCRELKISASNSSELIEKIQQEFPENLFLLIDETQALVGEKLSIGYDDHLRKYWQLLSDLIQDASQRLYGLHVFHGLSANSADAINRVGQIPAILKFKRHIFSLKALNEEEQWKMICDHIEKALIDNNIQPASLIERGVSRCLNNLTGGNPRFVLDLMDKIFYRAQSQGLDKIDGSICFKTLCDTPHFNTTEQNYFDLISINDVLDQLKAGQQFEQKIAEMLKQHISYILGEWSGIDQTVLAQYQLTVVNIRRVCNSLKEKIVMFDQPPGETSFRLSYDFLRLIRVRIQKTLTNIEDKELLLRLQLQPETLVPAMTTGIQKVMSHNGFHGQFRPLQTSTPFKIFVTSLGGDHLAQNIKVGLAVYKGDEIPQDVFEKIVVEIEDDRCTIIIIIENANTCHDQFDSSFKSFKDHYNGDIDLEKRFIFINGTDASGKEFDEDFFVQLVRIEIQENEAKNWYGRLQINKRFKEIEEDCIYCPEERERILIEELFKRDRSFKIGEMQDLQDNFNWVNRARLDKLSLYLNKTGHSFTTPDIEKVSPFKSILGKLQSTETGLLVSEIESFITTKYIRTGAQVAINAYVKWALRLLVDHNKVAKVNERYSYKDLDRELKELVRIYTDSLKSVKEDLGKYDSAGIEVDELKDISDRVDNNNQRIETLMINSTTVVKIEEHKDALRELDELARQSGEIPEKARIVLRDQLDETQNKFEAIKQRASWPFEDIENLYEHFYGLGKIKKNLKHLEDIVKEDVPQQKRYREEMKDINKRLEGLGSLLNGEITSGTYEGQEVDGCIFNIVNAIKDGKQGKITLHFSQ